MPSVRIRDSAYSPLVDSLDVQHQRSSTTPGTTPSNDYTPSQMAFLPRMRTMPALRNQGSPSSTSPQPSLGPSSPHLRPPQLRPQRARAGTVSRVHDHCIRSCARYSHAVASADRQNLPLLPHERDISHGTPSVAAATTGSNLSFQHTGDSIRASDPNEMHHDDVIEHLDVIGGFLYLLSPWFRMSLFPFRLSSVNYLKLDQCCQHNLDVILIFSCLENIC
jgi:hypothetical protein